MPELILQVISIDAAPPTQVVKQAFSDTGGTIGRDETNALALPDKHRRVSRLHAAISFPGGVPTITNSSSSLPILLGEQQLDGGESMPITHGALIEIGPYILRADLTQAQSRGSGLALGLVNAPASPVEPLPPARGADWSTPSSAQPVALESLIAGRSDTLDQAPRDLPPPAFVMPQAVKSPPIFAEHPPSSSPSDPFADLLSGIGGTAAPPADLTRASPTYAPAGLNADPLLAFGAGVHGAVDPPQSSLRSTLRNAESGTGAVIPDDFNPFELPSDVPRNAADPLAALIDTSSAGNVRALGVGEGEAPSIDSLFQLGAQSGSDRALFGITSEARANDGTLDGLIRAEGTSDPLSLFDSPISSSEPFSRPMRDDSMEIGSAFSPPTPNWGDVRPNKSPAEFAHAMPANPMAPPPPVAVAAMVPGGPTAVVAPDVLAEAFLRGAGLAPGALPHGLTPEIMTIVGSLLRSATAGAVDMLAARAATKREVQASVTIISVQANNPLKFLPNADAALLQLLGKKMPGFMRADVAMRDAFDDLRAHEVGVIAGTRAALTEVLGKFDPAVLGDKLSRGSVLESLMPSARKAKLWDMYLERYLQIRREAEDDFQSIFGRAFVQAYERETARIKGGASMAGGERGS